MQDQKIQQMEVAVVNLIGIWEREGQGKGLDIQRGW